MNGDLERADASNSKAIEIARRIDDDRTLCEALFNPLLVPAALSGKQSQSLLKRLGELLGIAERLNDADFRTRALATRIYYCAEFGDREGMIEALDTFCSLIEGQQMTHQQWVGQHGRAMLAYYWTATLQPRRGLLKTPISSVAGDMVRASRASMACKCSRIRREQGRLSEVAPIVRHFIDKGNLNTWKPGFAVVAAELGFKPQAQKLLDELRDRLRASNGCGAQHYASYLADVCAALGDAVSAHASMTCLSLIAT